MHVVEVKVPVLLVVKVTVPVGVIAPVPEESATVAVQLVAVLSGTLAGEQDTVVVVVLAFTASVNVAILVPWLESPA